MMQIEHNPKADAIYVRLRDLPYAYGRDLDESRRIDYGADNRPIGVELLDVSRGVDLRGLPNAEQIAQSLVGYPIRLAV
jgi:uncharacterized protein YuzE